MVFNKLEFGPNQSLVDETISNEVYVHGSYEQPYIDVSPNFARIWGTEQLKMFCSCNHNFALHLGNHDGLNHCHLVDCDCLEFGAIPGSPKNVEPEKLGFGYVGYKNMKWGNNKDSSNGETRTTSSTGAEKGVKPQRYDLIPVGPLALVAELYGNGAKKYADHNWRAGYEWSKSYSAMQRHLNAFWGGEDIDEEMGLPHLACAVFHAFTLMEYMETHPEFDDRYKGPDDEEA